MIPFKLNSVLSVLTISLYPSITSIEISVFGSFLIISTIYLPPITILPSSLVLVNLSFDINDLIDTSVSLAYKYKPSSFNSNFIPVNIGIKFFVDIALAVLFKLSNNISFFTLNLIIIIILLILLISLFFSYFIYFFISTKPVDIFIFIHYIFSFSSFITI